MMITIQCINSFEFYKFVVKVRKNHQTLKYDRNLELFCCGKAILRFSLTNYIMNTLRDQRNNR